MWRTTDAKTTAKKKSTVHSRTQTKKVKSTKVALKTTPILRCYLFTLRPWLGRCLPAVVDMDNMFSVFSLKAHSVVEYETRTRMRSSSSSSRRFLNPPRTYRYMRHKAAYRLFVYAWSRALFCITVAVAICSFVCVCSCTC